MSKMLPTFGPNELIVLLPVSKILSWGGPRACGLKRFR